MNRLASLLYSGLSSVTLISGLMHSNGRDRSGYEHTGHVIKACDVLEQRSITERPEYEVERTKKICGDGRI